MNRVKAARPRLAILRSCDLPYFTKATLAEHLSVSERTVANYIRRGWLPAYRLGSSVRIDPEDVLAFLEARRINPEEER